MRPRVLAVAACVGGMLLAGCHRTNISGCEGTRRYAGAESASPIQIPDDLTPPAETDALRLPPAVSNTRPPTQPCLEDPPAYSEQIRLGREADAAKSDAKTDEPKKPSRRERRQQRRQSGGTE